MPCYRRHWDETRGDEYAAWGTATYYFWLLDGSAEVEAQIEVYESGVTLAYDRYHVEDQYGMRSAEPLDPMEWSAYEIDIDTFHREALNLTPFNRSS